MRRTSKRKAGVRVSAAQSRSSLATPSRSVAVGEASGLHGHGGLEALRPAAEAMPLSRAHAHWLTGDWQALVALGDAAVERHPQRERLALLVACAHQQRGDHDRAQHHVRQALAWGGDARLVARLLISGVHNTLGRVGALQQDTAMLTSQFGQALEVTGDRDNRAAVHSRAVREMARLGLLPEAAGLLEDELRDLERTANRPAVMSAQVQMLRSEVELLQHELSLAQQRNHLHLSDATPDQPRPESFDARLRRLSTSQLGQDLWVLERTGYKRDGFFVEFGATDGVRLSNTYLLETEFGWRGICAEPNPKMFAQLQRSRRCAVSDACIGARTGERVDFVLANEYGGMVRHMDSDMHAAKREAYYVNDESRASFVTTSLHDLLTRLGAPHAIDYLSIDTEGSEFEILASFPFDRWKISLLTVEHNFAPERGRIRALLESHGYSCVEARWDDWYWRES